MKQYPNSNFQFPIVRPRKRFPASRGFTLAELLLAIAILGVGMTMVMAIFPVAVKENENSFGKTVGRIVAQNGIAAVETFMTQGQAGENTNLLSRGAGKYPFEGGSKFGYLPFIKYNGDPFDPNETDNSYLLVVTSYMIIGNGGHDDVVPLRIACNIPAGKVRITGAPADSLRVGSPLIAYRTTNPDSTLNGRSVGAYATIVKVNLDRNEGTLDHPIDPFDTVTEAYIVQQNEKPRLSPALSTTSTRTSFRP